MSAVLGVFGVDWRLLIINLVNFSILLGALTYFLYKPVTKMLDSRRASVEEGVKNAVLASERLKSIEAAEAGKLADATAQAEKLISDARGIALAKEKEIVQRGETAASALLSEAERQAVEAQREAVSKSKEAVAKLIVLGMERSMAAKK